MTSGLDAARTMPITPFSATLEGRTHGRGKVSVVSQGFPPTPHSEKLSIRLEIVAALCGGRRGQMPETCSPNFCPSDGAWGRTWKHARQNSNKARGGIWGAISGRRTPSSTNIGQALTKVGPHPPISADVGQNWSDPGQLWSKLGQC